MSRTDNERGRLGHLLGHRAARSFVLGTAALLTVFAMAGVAGFEPQPGAGEVPPAGATPLSDGSGVLSTPSAQPSSVAWWIGPTGFENERTQALGLDAIDLLDFDWQTRLPDWRVEFVEGNTQVAGYTWSRERRIEVFVRPDADATDLARILSHELGHAVDVTHNAPSEREQWLEQRGLAADTPWWPSSGAADFETGAGDFAESFAAWLVGPEDFRSLVGPTPSKEDLALLARLATE